MTRLAGFGLVLCSLFFLNTEPSVPPAQTYQSLDAVLWVQTSAEYRASTEETYHAAKEALLRGLQDDHWTAALEQSGRFENLPPAVVLDLDETILDNSSFMGQMLSSGETYSPQKWDEWVKQERDGLVPGAFDFLIFAHMHGVTPIYISNRTCDPSNPSDPTVGLLRKLRLPLGPRTDDLFCSTPATGDDKTSRRAEVAKKFRILLLIGDQLTDFLQVSATHCDDVCRDQLFDVHQTLWGDRWFQIPNPTYGAWNNILGPTTADKLSHLRK